LSENRARPEDPQDASEPRGTKSSESSTFQ
jgi:hypothetical protein